MERRRFLGVASSGLTVGAAGCVDEFLGDELDSGSDRDDDVTRGPAKQTPSDQVLEMVHPRIDISKERFDAEALAYDVTLQADLDGADHATITASEIGDDESTTERLTSSGRHVIEGLAAGTELRFEASGGHIPSLMRHVVGTEAGVTLEGQDRLAGLKVSSVPEPTGEAYDRQFVWEFRGRGFYEGTLRIPLALYEYCTARPRINKYGFYAGDAFNDVYVERLADLFTDQTDLTGNEQVELAISFVQSLEYTSDSVTAGYDEYQRYPVETLVDRGGDCEDTAILLGAILEKMGYGVRGVLLPGHMALAVKGDTNLSGTYYTEGGDRYYYVETTGEGWRVGQIPDAHRGQRARLVRLSGYPCLNFKLISFDDTRGVGPFMYTLQNAGDAVARDVRFDIEFVDAARRTVTGTRLRVNSLSPEENRREAVVVLAPEESTRVKLRHSIYHDGELHTRHESEFL